MTAASGSAQRPLLRHCTLNDLW